MDEERLEYGKAVGSAVYELHQTPRPVLQRRTSLRDTVSVKRQNKGRSGLIVLKEGKQDSR